MSGSKTDSAALAQRLTRSEFLQIFGGIYEDSTWVAEAVWQPYCEGQIKTAGALHAVMRAAVEASGYTEKLALLRAHPELAGRAAKAGELTDSSRKEQSSAALDQCTPDEYAAFQELNAAYTKKFEFPFIVAVTGMDRSDILCAFRTRLEADRQAEFAAALEQVHRIAWIRIQALHPGDAFPAKQEKIGE